MNTTEINVVDLFFNAGLVSSKGEIRRLIQQNGAAVDGQKCNSPDDVVTKPLGRDYVLLKKGKKNYVKVKFA